MVASHRMWLVAFASSTIATAATYRTSKCSSLVHSTNLSAYNTTLLNTTHYPIGAYNLSGTLNKVAFCGVQACISYGVNDTLAFELWLPDTKYSSRLMAIGNGGDAGVISYQDMLTDLNSGLGFAVAGGNAGHLASENDASPGSGGGAPGVYQPFLNDKDQVKAWLHDAIALFTPAAKALLKKYFGKAPKHSYFRGCSAGGAQGFSLVEFYPDLFDGVIAGCPFNWATHNMLGFLWNAQHTNVNETALTTDILDFLHASVMRECDEIDGLADNLIDNPLECHFDVSFLACTADTAANNTCLTPSQINAAKALYQGPVRADSANTSVWPGLSFGSEGGWWLPQVQAILSNGFSVPVLQNIVYKNLSYDPNTFNWASDIDLMDARAGLLIDSINTDLSSFRKKGGKMIVNAGWADPNIAPKWALQHVEAITKDTIGSGTTVAENDFIKLVLIPGGGHCGASPTTPPALVEQYDFSAAIVKWVEGGVEPVKGIKQSSLIPGDSKTKRLCTWPQHAKLKEGGDIDDWESYTCELSADP